MRKGVGPRETLFFYPEFPKRFGKKANALIGVGGNIGNVPRRFKKVLQILKKHPRIRIVRTAPLLKNPPFGYLEQDDFFNTLFLVQTTLSPEGLLRFCLYLEKRFKRKRSFKNAPRTLDLDILCYKKQKRNSPHLTIPHPEYKKRRSVMVPLAYIGATPCDL